MATIITIAAQHSEDKERVQKDECQAGAPQLLTD